MRTEVFHINDENLYRYSLMHHNQKGVSNSEDRNRMKKILKKALVGELTELQRLCITEHYLGNKTQRQIAKELGVNESTVSRHVNAAKRKLQSIARYYC